MASRSLRRAVGELLDLVRGKPATWRQLPKPGEPHKRPWVPPGWPYAGWFNFNPSHSTGIHVVSQPQPDARSVTKKLDPKYDIAKRHGNVLRSIDQLSLDHLRSYIYDVRGPIYADRRPKPTAEEIESGFVARLESGSFAWTEHEKQDLLSRRRFRAELSEAKFDDEAERNKLDETLMDSAESRQFLKSYSRELEGFGWKDPYELTDEEVMEEAAVLRDLFIYVPNRPWHAPQHEWTQRQDLLVDQWRSTGLPCFAGDPYRYERTPEPAWTAHAQIIGQHPDADCIWGPPGSARSETDDEMLPPGTDPSEPKPKPIGFSA